MKRFIFSRYVKIVLIAVALVAMVVFGSHLMIVRSASGRLFTDKNALPCNEVGLVLGASKYVRPKVVNPYFRKRMLAAAELYHSGKVKHLLVSGQNSERNYNEPLDMKNMLIELGVPEHAITCDYAGFRTFDSVVRAWKVFGQKKFTIISQKFHNERALFICNYFGLDCVAYNAKDVYGGYSTGVREYFARTKAVLDLYLLGTEPHFLGEPIRIDLTTQR